MSVVYPHGETNPTLIYSLPWVDYINPQEESMLTELIYAAELSIEGIMDMGKVVDMLREMFSEADLALLKAATKTHSNYMGDRLLIALADLM